MQKLNGLNFLRKFENFLDLAVRRVAAKYPDVSIYDLSSGPTIVDRGAGDANGIWACLHWGEYDEALSTLPHGLRRGDPISVLDCGANVGGFGILLANRGFCLKEYHAVEMNPRTFGRAAFNLTNWRGQRPAHLINAAVTGECGRISIEDSFGDTGQSIYRSPHSHTGKASEISVPTVTIARLLDKEAWPEGLPELIKLDIEGAEFDVVPQLTAELLQATSVLIVEIHPLRNLPASGLVLSMSALGFECCLRPQSEWGVYVFRRGAGHALYGNVNRGASELNT